VISRSTRFLARSRSGDDGVAMMETDVMRFMAIFAFCLMAIFALVQSADIEYVQSTVNVKRTESRITELEKKLAVSAARLEVNKNANERIQKELRFSELESERWKARWQTLYEGQKTNKQKSRVTTIQEPVKKQSIAKQIKQVEKREPTKPVKSIQPKKTVSKKQGFTLSFDSDAALLSLIQQNRVALYAVSKDQSWRISLKHGQVSYTKSILKGNYYPMTADTVPSSISRKMSANSHVNQWFVELPIGVRQRITKLMKGKTGGDLIINAKSQVQFIN